MRKLLAFGLGLSFVFFGLTAMAGTPAGGGGLFVESGDGASSKLTVSGELRMRYQYIDDMLDSMSGGNDRGDAIDVRARLSLGFELASGMDVKLTAQSWYLGGGVNGFNDPVEGFTDGEDRDSLDVYEAYARVKFALAGRESVVTVGRMELAFGSELVLGNNSKYFGLTNDAVRFDIKALDKLTVTAFAAKLVENSVGAFENDMTQSYYFDSTNNDTNQFGLWATYEINEDIAVHGFVVYFNDQNDDWSSSAMFETFGGWGAQIFTVGAELALKKMEFSGHKIDAAVNGALQFGTIKAYDDDVSAFAVELEVGYMPPLPWSPRFAVGFALGSGDDDPDDSDYGRFVAPAQDISDRLGKADLFNLSNLTCMYFEATCKPMDIEKLSVGLAFLRFSATEKDDDEGVGGPIYGSYVTGGDDAVADEVDLFVSYKINDNADLKFCFSWIEPDDVINNDAEIMTGFNGNSPMQQAHLTLTVKF